jgi:small multidrug resistance pump
LKGIDVSLAYAVWSGIGTVIIATIGILCFEEPATVSKVVSIGLIVIGVAGLKLSGVNH